MDRDELLKLITLEDVKEIMEELGSKSPIPDKQNNWYFTTVCHGGDSMKLLYYSSSKMFQCLTCCGSMSLYDVVSNAMGNNFSEAFKYVANFKGVNLGKRKVGLQKARVENDDLEFLGLHLYKPSKQTLELPKFDECVLGIFDPSYPLDWFEEGINEEIAEQFDIRFYRNQNKAIIPHRDINGNLVGVRARSYNTYDVLNGRKYMPITIQGLTYRYPMGFNLYGLYQNKDNIKRHRKVIIVESEKSVLLFGSMYSMEDNIVLALGGMNMSLYQRDMILSLGVEEIVLCLDKEYSSEMYDNKETKEYRQVVQYFKKIKKISSMFINYCNVSIILCWDDRLELKDCPLDKGKEIYEELFEERYLIDDIEELNDLTNE